VYWLLDFVCVYERKYITFELTHRGDPRAQLQMKQIVNRNPNSPSSQAAQQALTEVGVESDSI
jgi:hypothetical protein